MADKKDYAILVVDDESNILNALRRELSTPPLGNNRYAVEGFDNPQAALERAASQHFDAVICDYRMPEMDGVEFLTHLNTLQPDCAQLVLSGQTDMPALMRMINDLHIFRFIPKPWHDYYLKSSLAQALAQRESMLLHRRLAESARARGLPAPPEAESWVENVVLVDQDERTLQTLRQELEAHNYLDDLYAALHGDNSGARSRRLSNTRIHFVPCRTSSQAMEYAHQADVSLIIASDRGAPLNGMELLRHFAEAQPDCARILLLSNHDMDQAVQALNDLQVQGIFIKPWQQYEIRMAFAQALATRRLILRNRLLTGLALT